MTRSSVTPTFRLTHLVAREAVFENPEHDFPKRISYRREGSVLHARVEGAPGDRVAEWSWELAGGSAD